MLYDTSEAGDGPARLPDLAAGDRLPAPDVLGEPIPTTPDAEAETPVEQLALTGDRTDYCWYLADLPADADAPADLVLPSAGDVLHVHVDGELVGTFTPTGECRDPSGHVHRLTLPPSGRRGRWRS